MWWLDSHKPVAINWNLLVLAGKLQRDYDEVLPEVGRREEEGGP